MSYIVLARKWRPQNFDDLVGQETVVKTFKNALSSGKIVHAYLFSGPRGVGKTSSARILAKALNCLQRTGSDPCGQCESCKAITEGHSVDVFEIDGASNTGVDAVRELRETVKYAPSGGKYKIYIIDEVHMLSVPAFNALLKTLEEPPPHVVFIFATTEPKKIPATILSRCQHHSFRRVTKNRIKEQLGKITDAEQINIKEAALEMIAKAADGSMRDALTLLDQACSFSDDITEKELQTLLGLPDAEVIFNLSEAILKGDASSSLSIIKEFTDRGSDLRQIAKELVEQFRNITIVKITQDAEDVFEFSREDTERLRGLAAGVSIEELTLLLTELLRLEGEVRNAVNPRYTLELGLLRTSFVKGMTSIGDVMKMLSGPQGADYVRESGPQPAHDKLKNTQESPSPVKSEIRNPKPEISEAPPAEKKTEPVKQPAPDIITVTADKEELWQKLIAHLDSQDHLLACKLAEATLINMTTAELSIGFNGGMSVLADSIRKSAPVINPILQKLSGHSIKLKILALPKKEIKNDINKMKEKVFSEPIVQDAMRIFNGSMVKVKSLEEDKGADNSD
ncbi:MAG: DNA polymerase III subunit gamma/tau [Nitrospirae bacterium]|nr:DNA polymerase III subunit gamma/tau [Nitrospirota bacterium]